MLHSLHLRLGSGLPMLNPSHSLRTLRWLRNAQPVSLHRGHQEWCKDSSRCSKVTLLPPPVRGAPGRTWQVLDSSWGSAPPNQVAGKRTSKVWAGCVGGPSRRALASEGAAGSHSLGAHADGGWGHSPLQHQQPSLHARVQGKSHS